MNYSICLDQFSTNFNVNNLSSNGFSIYTNLDNFTTPIAQNIPYQDLFSPPIGNCPYVANLPQGATQLVVIDACASMPTDIASIFNPSGTTAGNLTTTCCYAVINVPAQPISWCDTSGLEFDIFSSSYIGQIVAGNLTSNIGTVTDYTIGWYKDGDYSSPEFISGYGQAFSPYQFTHPLTGNSAVPSLAGDWEGIIHDIAINGTTYSSVSGSANGTPIPFESCFDTVVVSPLQCDNGTFPGNYSHQFNFNSQAIGTTPTPVSLTYALDSTTKHFAYFFKGFSVYDELEIKWKSGNPQATSNPTLYSQSIYLEKIKVGTDMDTVQYQPPNTAAPLLFAVTPTTTISNINNVWPKSTTSLDNNGFFQRTLTLTNLETSSNPLFPDFLEITVTPNPANNNTQWQAGFQCLDTFDCTNCVFEDYPNNLNNKIFAFNLSKTYGCDSQYLFAAVSGCTPSSDLIGAKINQFNINSPSINLVGAHQQPTAFGQSVSLGGQTSCQAIAYSNSPNWTSIYSNPNNSCSPSTNTTITFNKTPGQIQLTFNDYNDYMHYKNNLVTNVLTSNPNFITPKICIDQTVGYYQVFSITLPFQQPNVDCGDNTTNLYYFFHINDYLNVTYVNDNNPNATSWSITIPQTQITNCFLPASCNSCLGVVDNFVTGYNNHVNNSTTFSYVTNKGSKYLSPFNRHFIVRGTSGGVSGSYCFTTGTNSYLRLPWYSVHTIPFISSSNGWTNLPSLGGPLPCDLTPFSQRIQSYMLAFYGKWQIRFPHLTGSFNYSLSTNDFEVYALSGPASPITGSTINVSSCPTGSLIYSYIGGVATMYEPSYFANGTYPSLTIAP
jgi:hypothetical protein